MINNFNLIGKFVLQKDGRPGIVSSSRKVGWDTFCMVDLSEKETVERNLKELRILSMEEALLLLYKGR